MKRNISLWLGVLAFALLPALAQQAPAGPKGKIHGHVTNPTGAAVTGGTVSLSNDGGHTSVYTFPVDANGDYKGEAPPGTYTVVFRQPDTPPDKMVDSIDDVKIVASEDTLQDDRHVPQGVHRQADPGPEEAARRFEEAQLRSHEGQRGHQGPQR